MTYCIYLKDSIDQWAALVFTASPVIGWILQPRALKVLLDSVVVVIDVLIEWAQHNIGRLVSPSCQKISNPSRVSAL